MTIRNDSWRIWICTVLPEPNLFTGRTCAEDGALTYIAKTSCMPGNRHRAGLHCQCIRHRTDPEDVCRYMSTMAYAPPWLTFPVARAKIHTALIPSGSHLQPRASANLLPILTDRFPYGWLRRVARPTVRAFRRADDSHCS